MFAGFQFDRARRRFWRQLDCARALAETHADAIVLARSADDIRAARAAGKLALFLGVEGSYAIDDDMDAGVARLAEAGVRFLGPLWERDSRAGTSCRTPAARDSGLTDHGRALVRALQRRRHPARRRARQQEDVLGHARVLAHAAVFVALGRGRRAPARAQPRRRSDPRARRARRHRRRHLRRRRTSADCSARSSASPTTSSTSRSVGGEDCVALGSDFDGFMTLPRGLRDAADLPRLTEVLWRRGWREPRLGKLLGGNALRYLS